MCSSVTLCVQASQHYQSCHGSVVAQGASTAIFTLCLARAFHNESVKIYMCCEHSLTQNNILFTLPVTVVNCTRGHSPADLANGRRASLCPSQNQNIMPQITPARLLGSFLCNEHAGLISLIDHQSNTSTRKAYPRASQDSSRHEPFQMQHAQRP